MADRESRLIRIGSDGSIATEFAIPDVWRSFDLLRDGGYVLSGNGPNGNVLFALLRLNANGELVWRNNYALPGGRTANQVRATRIEVPVRVSADGSFVVAMTTRGLVRSGYTVFDGNGYPYEETNITLVRVSADGIPEWLRVHGARQLERLMHLSTTSDGGYLISAMSDSLAQPTELINRIPDGSLDSATWSGRSGIGRM